VAAGACPTPRAVPERAARRRGEGGARPRGPGRRGRAARRLRGRQPAARRCAAQGAAIPARVPVPRERRVPRRRQESRHRGLEEGSRDRAGKRPLQEEPGAAHGEGRAVTAASAALPPEAGRDLLAAAAIAAALFAVYAWGACRTVYVGDSGDLAT